MSKNTKTLQCPECGHPMRYEKHDDVLTYKGQSRTIKTLGWWCLHCGEAILSGEPLVAHEKAFQQFKAELDGVLGPAEVAKARAALKLSQRQASELLGGGPRSFQKYEAGTQAVSVAMSHLLRLLENDPSRLVELRAQSFRLEVKGASKPPSTSSTKGAARKSARDQASPREG